MEHQANINRTSQYELDVSLLLVLEIQKLAGEFRLKSGSEGTELTDRQVFQQAVDRIRRDRKILLELAPDLFGTEHPPLRG